MTARPVEWGAPTTLRRGLGDVAKRFVTGPFFGQHEGEHVVAQFGLEGFVGDVGAEAQA